MWQNEFQLVQAAPTLHQADQMKYLLIIVAIILAFLLLIYLSQDKLMLFPMPEDPGRAEISVPGAQPWRDGEYYRGLVFEPDGDARGTILFFHGNAGAAQYRAPYARRMLGFGYRVVLQEYPGFGARPGTASMANALESAVEDALAAREKWTGPIYLMGESLGAGMAAQIAHRFPERFAGVALFTPWESLSRLVNEKFNGFPMSILLRVRLDTRKALEAYPGNVVIVGAERDTLIPVDHARALADSRTRYIELKGAGHNDWFDAMTPGHWEAVLSAVSKH